MLVDKILDLMLADIESSPRKSALLQREAKASLARPEEGWEADFVWSLTLAAEGKVREGLEFAVRHLETDLTTDDIVELWHELNRKANQCDASGTA